jgi:hypothetical protein
MVEEKNESSFQQGEMLLLNSVVEDEDSESGN